MALDGCEQRERREIRTYSENESGDMLREDIYRYVCMYVCVCAYVWSKPRASESVPRLESTVHWSSSLRV